jgi:hypothetical protein
VCQCVIGGRGKAAFARRRRVGGASEARDGDFELLEKRENPSGHLPVSVYTRATSLSIEE